MKRQAPAPLDRQAHDSEGHDGEGYDGEGYDGEGYDGARRRASASAQPLLASLQSVATRAQSWRRTAAREVALRPRGWRAVAVSAGIAGILAILVALQSPLARGPEQTAPGVRRFFVSGQPVLTFDHFIGRVHMQPGPDGQVTITENENGETDAITIHYAQRADAIAVTVDIQSGLMQDTWVDFDVSVPRQTGFTATIATGTLEAMGLSGQIALNGTNGSIWATDLTGSISLQTQSGSINLTHVTGQVSAVTQNGTITTTATQLEGRSTMQADSGTINFHGTLDRTGRALFQNTNGAVGLTLPSNAAFALSATSVSGSINSDFAGLTISHQSGRSEAHGATGSGQRAQLTIRTAGGSIGLYQGG